MLAIANALCFLPDVQNAPNVGGDAKLSLKDVYLRNSWVSLWSAGRFHPEAKRLLLTNAPLGEDEQRFREIGAEVVEVPWSRYVLPESYRWRLAYYKLDALEWLSQQEGLSFLVDADAFFVSPVQDLVEEGGNALFLYDTQHRHEHPYRTEIRNLQKDLLGEVGTPVHWGGEAVFGSQKALQIFTRECARVFNAMVSQQAIFTPERDQSDEVVLSIAAERLTRTSALPIRQLNPYLYRYWTSNGFNLLSTNYKYNPVSVWHFPLEKKDGILALYDYIREHDSMPPLQELYYMLHLEKTESRLLKDMVLKRLRRWGLWKDK